MPRRSFCRFSLLLLLMWLLSGCGYHLTNQVQRNPAIVRTVWVPFIGNESSSASAQTVLRRALYDEFYTLRGAVAAHSEAVAGYYVKGKLLSYTKTIVSYNAADQVREYRLALNVELELYRNGVAAPIWKGPLQATKIFPVNSNLALQRNAEESALEEVAHLIAQKLISSVEYFD